jgi:hypothetical protein
MAPLYTERRSSAPPGCASILNRLGIDQNVMDRPQQATPDDVAKVAAQAQQTHPDAFNQAMSFFHQHPTW